jgi:hypothetical protein
MEWRIYDIWIKNIELNIQFVVRGHKEMIVGSFIAHKGGWFLLL